LLGDPNRRVGGPKLKASKAAPVSARNGADPSREGPVIGTSGSVPGA